MTILAQDTFIRANQSGWGIASDSESWTTSGASSTQSIAADEGIIAVTGGGDVHNQLGAQTTSDQDILCRITINNVSDTAGIQARFSSANGSTAYKLLYYSNDLHLNKAFAGNSSPIASYGGYILTPGIAYWFRLRCVGTTIFAMVWPDGGTPPANWLMTITDVSIASGGFAVLANSNAGIGVQFDHFSASDVGKSSEVALAIAWLYATLSGDTALQGLAPGGVWRAEAPPSTTTPYVIILNQAGSGKDHVVFGGGRALSDMLFMVIAAGPAKITQTIANAAAQIDALLTVPQQTAVIGGTIIASFRDQPFEEDRIIDGEVWTNIGGMYRIMAKSS